MDKGDDRGRVQWNIMCLIEILGFPGGSDGKESACNAGDLSSIPGLGRSLEKEMATHSSTPVFFPGERQGQRSKYNVSYILI